jgi:cytochrome bd ubiquinol oxidase subunit II
VHGAHWLALKTEGETQSRARGIAARGWRALVLFTLLSLAATIYVRPPVLDNFQRHAWGWLIPLLVVGALIAMRYLRAHGRDLAAFLASVFYLVAMMGGAAFAQYPYLLTASTDPAYSLTIYNAKTGPYSLRIGLLWWLAGITLALGYFIFLYRFFWGKVTLEQSTEQHT